ncbi:MAG: MOSC domain-containing protein [Anaerolineae bacterium]|nr:MAG: MOSC domain-containing protein [Anaerolineae bacterium]
MKLISINIGKEQTLVRPGKTEQTGIFKQPVQGAVQVTWQGLPGDFIGDSKHHGGPDQAIYIYGWTDYAWWEKELGHSVQPGLFGENLTIEGLESAQFHIGDQLHIGTVILQVTAPRIPCGTLAGRMNMPSFVRQFRQAERPGLYCRVLQEGTLQDGDTVTIEKFTGETVSLLEAMRDHYEPNLSEASIHRFLAAPIAFRMRKKKEEQLAQLRISK